MFHPFRTKPTKRVHTKSSHDPSETTPIMRTKLFGGHHRDSSPPPVAHKPLLDECDSSLDMSLYTSDTKSTMQYAGNNACCFDFSSFPAPCPPTKEPENKQTRPELRSWMSGSALQVNTPSTAPSSPSPEFNDDRARKVARRFTFEDSDYRSNSKSARRNSERTGPIDLDEEQTGPVDLDELSEADDDASSSNSWVLSPTGMAPTEIYEEESKLDEHAARETYVPPPPRVQSPLEEDDDEEDERHSPFVWTDDDDEQREGTAGLRLVCEQKLSDEDAAILNESYHQAMMSISSKSFQTLRRYSDSSVDTGSVRLTQAELQKHLRKVQAQQPLPSTSIQGFDKWREWKEGRQRHFDKLREGQQSKPKPIAVKYLDNLGDESTPVTQGQMDHSVSSTIPTDASSLKPRHKSSNPKNRWSILPKLHASSKKNKKTKRKSTGQRRDTSTPVSSLKEFIRIDEDEASQYADFSLAPLNKMGALTLSVPEEDKHIVMHFLEKEREKQLQAELEKDKEEKIEQSRIQKLKQEALRRQRELNGLCKEKMRLNQPKVEPGEKERREQERLDKFKLEALKRQQKLNIRLPVKANDVRNSSPLTIPESSSCSYEDPIPLEQSTSFSSSHSLPLEQSTSFSSSHFSTGSSTIPLRKTYSFRSTVSSLHSGTTVVLSPCIICDVNERTHVCMPCMHFYFCEGCAKDMEKCSERPICPVCSAENVAFTRVHVG